jgi:anti-sigma factor RsiW
VTAGTVAAASAFSTEARLAREAVARHARSMPPGKLLDKASSDPVAVRTWIWEQIDFVPPVPDLSAAGFNLAGARVDRDDGPPTPAVVYRRGTRIFTLFARPTGSAARSDARLREYEGCRVASWRRPGLDVWAVSDADEGTLREFAAGVAESMVGHCHAAGGSVK